MEDLNGAKTRALREMVRMTLSMGFGAVLGVGIVSLVIGLEPFVFVAMIAGMVFPWLITGSCRFIQPRAQLKAEARRRDRLEGRGNYPGKAFWILWWAMLVVFLIGGLFYLLTNALSA